MGRDPLAGSGLSEARRLRVAPRNEACGGAAPSRSTLSKGTCAFPSKHALVFCPEQVTLTRFLVKVARVGLPPYLAHYIRRRRVGPVFS